MHKLHSVRRWVWLPPEGGRTYPWALRMTWDTKWRWLRRAGPVLREQRDWQRMLRPLEPILRGNEVFSGLLQDNRITGMYHWSGLDLADGEGYPIFVVERSSGCEELVGFFASEAHVAMFLKALVDGKSAFRIRSCHVWHVPELEVTVRVQEDPEMFARPLLHFSKKEHLPLAKVIAQTTWALLALIVLGLLLCLSLHLGGSSATAWVPRAWSVYMLLLGVWLSWALQRWQELFNASVVLGEIIL